MRERSWRVVLTGAAIAAVSLLLMPLPLLTGAKIGRFILLLALVGLLLGMSIILNAIIDRWRGT